MQIKITIRYQLTLVRMVIIKKYTNNKFWSKATVRTGHGATDWFQIGKGVCQGCILSLCLYKGKEYVKAVYYYPVYITYM